MGTSQRAGHDAPNFSGNFCPCCGAPLDARGIPLTASRCMCAKCWRVIGEQRIAAQGQAGAVPPPGWNLRQQPAGPDPFPANPEEADA